MGLSPNAVFGLNLQISENLILNYFANIFILPQKFKMKFSQNCENLFRLRRPPSAGWRRRRRTADERAFGDSPFMLIILFMLNNQRKIQIGVIGSAGQDDYKNNCGASEEMIIIAKEVGKLLAKANAVVVTGGKDGIMEAAARGAKIAGGLTVGVIKGRDRFMSNQYIDIEVLSGMIADGFDELTLVLMCDALIVIGGGAGTLQEIAIAYRNNKPIVVIDYLGGWGKKLAGEYLDERKKVIIKSAKNPNEAVNLVLSEIAKLTVK